MTITGLLPQLEQRVSREAPFSNLRSKVVSRRGSTDLYGVLLHGERPVDAVQLEVEAARVAHGLALRVAPPQRRHAGLAVAAQRARPLGAQLLHTQGGYTRRAAPTGT